MKEGKLTNSDVTRNFIVLDKSVHGLFKHLVEHRIKIVDQDDCEFFFDVKRYKNGQLFLTQTQGFIDQWNLKESDIIQFKYDDKIESFVVNIKKNDSGQKKEDTLSSNTASIDEKEKLKLLSTISETCTSIVSEYSNIFNTKCYLPTKVALSSLVINGFTERNLTFNFCHSYLKKHPNAIVWQEIPIKNADRQHVDSIIIDNDWIIYLEAKRLYDIAHFKLLLDDLDRIKNLHPDIPLPLEHPTNKAIVLLADHYFNGESKKKKDKEEIYDLFFSGQNVNVEPEIIKDYPRLADINSAKIRKVEIKDPSIKILRENEYNINVWDDLVYTIYCGVCFLDETEKK